MRSALDYVTNIFYEHAGCRGDRMHLAVARVGADTARADTGMRDRSCRLHRRSRIAQRGRRGRNDGARVCRLHPGYVPPSDLLGGYDETHKTNPTCESADAPESYVTISRASTNGSTIRSVGASPSGDPASIRATAIARCWVSQALDPVYNVTWAITTKRRNEANMQNINNASGLGVIAGSHFVCSCKHGCW